MNAMNADIASRFTTGSPPIGLAPVYAQYPIEVVGADGVWLHTRDGRKVLDLYGGHAVASLGYGHQRWTEALRDQARAMNFQTNAVPHGSARARRAQAAEVLAGCRSTACSASTPAPRPTRTRSSWRSRCDRAARKSSRSKQSFHGRTAAAGAAHLGRAAEVVRLAARAVRRELDQAPRRRGHRQRTSPTTRRP